MITEEGLLIIPKAFKFKNRGGSWEWVEHTPLIPALQEAGGSLSSRPAFSTEFQDSQGCYLEKHCFCYIEKPCFKHTTATTMG